MKPEETVCVFRITNVCSELQTNSCRLENKIFLTFFMDINRVLTISISIYFLNAFFLSRYKMYLVYHVFPESIHPKLLLSGFGKEVNFSVWWKVFCLFFFIAHIAITGGRKGRNKIRLLVICKKNTKKTRHFEAYIIKIYN